MRTRTIRALFLAAALLSGCASAPTKEAHRSPGLQAGGECLGAALMMLKGGILLVPVSAGIALLCVPIAVIHELVPPVERPNDGTGAPNFAYPNGLPGCADRACELGAHAARAGAPEFAYPSTSSFGGCPDGRCGIGSEVNGARTWSHFYPNSYWGQYRRN